ncbi:DUF4760 domain-containing protein [Vibrio parahaemolyticus]|uniref:DUF4760 domain-containing protein n=1 Tax=Vibrio parahaemolyticus TaxID=670 RepID=UPI001123A767|nr:DUF4760 domain-containing protein [Vibrio parahaemolyticus]TNZ66624.1 hypothetical protein CGK43_23880 [Vibrio parahaemolyticus]
MSLDFFKVSLFEMLNAISSLMLAYGVFFFYHFSQKRERREKVEYATRYIQRWNDPSLFHTMARIFNSRNIEFLRSIDEESYEKFRVVHKDGFDDVVTILNFMEEVAQAVESGLADERTLRKYFQHSLIETYSILEHFVLLTRDQKFNTSAYRSTERLVGLWSFSEGLEAR